MKKVMLFLFSLIVCLGLCLYLRQKVTYQTFDEVLSLTKNISLLSTFDSFSNLHPRSLYVDDYKNIDSFDDLYIKSDVVAKISITTRKQKYNIVETTVNVQKDYKGTCKNEIIIYEPITFDGKGDCSAYASIPLLHQNQEYIVFLQKALPNDKKHYNYINTTLGVYPIKDNFEMKTIVLREAENTDFKEVYNADIIKVDFSKLPDEILDKESITNYYNHINKYNDFYNKVKEKYM